MTGDTAKHRTRRGVTYTLDRQRLEELRLQAAFRPKKPAVRGALVACIIAAHFLIIQYFLSESGLQISEEAIGRYALSAAGLAQGWWRLFFHPFLHPDVHSMLLNLAGLLFFGITLGWRHGRWMVLCTFFFGAAVGGAFFLLFGLPSGTALFYGADGAVAAVMAASILTNPRLVERQRWVPWNIIAGLLFLVAYMVLETPLFTTGTAALAGMTAGAFTGLLTAGWLVDHRHRNDFRLSSVFFAIGAVSFTRVIGHVGEAYSGQVSPASPVLWGSIVLGLALTGVGIIYVLVQELRVEDLKRFAQHEAIDDLVEEEIARQGMKD